MNIGNGTTTLKRCFVIMAQVIRKPICILEIIRYAKFRCRLNVNHVIFEKLVARIVFI